MNKDDPVSLTLLEISRCDKKPNVQPDDEKERRQNRKARDQLARERVEVRRRRVFVPVYLSARH